VVVPTTGQTCWAEAIVVVVMRYEGMCLRVESKVSDSAICVVSGYSRRTAGKQGGLGRNNRQRKSLLLRHLPYFALLSIFQHHKLREPRRARACLSNSAYNAGQRPIVRSQLAEALSTPLVSEPQSVSEPWVVRTSTVLRNVTF
jgi:hypothetical protein